MKLVFRKYMEFEDSLGNTSKLDELRRRVEDYLEKTYQDDEKSEGEAESGESDGKEAARSEESGSDSGS